MGLIITLFVVLWCLGAAFIQAIRHRSLKNRHDTTQDELTRANEEIARLRARKPSP